MICRQLAFCSMNPTYHTNSLNPKILLTSSYFHQKWRKWLFDRRNFLKRRPYNRIVLITGTYCIGSTSFLIFPAPQRFSIPQEPLSRSSRAPTMEPELAWTLTPILEMLHSYCFVRRWSSRLMWSCGVLFVRKTGWGSAAYPIYRTRSIFRCPRGQEN